MKTWTDHEVKILSHYYSMNPADIRGAAIELKKSYDVIRNKASREGFAKNNQIREEEYTYIKANYQSKHIAVMAREMNRNRLTVKNMLKKLGLTSIHTIHNKWNPTPEEIEMLKSGKILHDLSKILNKSYPTLRRIMRIHGIIPAQVQRVKRDLPPRTPRAPKPVKVVDPTQPVVPRNFDEAENRIRASMMRLGFL